MEIKDKRIIVVDATTNEKYVFPDRYEAGLAMGGTAERVRQKLVKDSGRLLYDKFRVFYYTEEKYNELTKEGIKDGSVISLLGKSYYKPGHCLHCRNCGRKIQDAPEECGWEYSLLFSKE